MRDDGWWAWRTRVLGWSRPSERHGDPPDSPGQPINVRQEYRRGRVIALLEMLYGTPIVAPGDENCKFPDCPKKTKTKKTTSRSSTGTGRSILCSAHQKQRTRWGLGNMKPVKGTK